MQAAFSAPLRGMGALSDKSINIKQKKKLIKIKEIYIRLQLISRFINFQTSTSRDFLIFNTGWHSRSVITFYVLTLFIVYVLWKLGTQIDSGKIN